MEIIDKRYLLLLAQFLAPIVAVWAVYTYATIPLLLISGVMFFLMRCIGSVITYHRILGHRTHRMHPFVEFVGTALGFYGSLTSPINFCAAHTLHHKFPDTEKDPHSVKLIGWKVMFPIFWLNSSTSSGDLRTVVRLQKNKNASFFHKYYWYLLLVPFSLLLISPQAYLFGYVVPLALSLISLQISTLNHDDHGAKPMGALFGIITCGEHHHKWHHDNPSDTTGEGWLNTVIELIATRNVKV
jgi:stearoyl-CoA desaturase (delta-9 desaturase)